jgi:FMN phosphatase YigB (HAD superfamily)
MSPRVTLITSGNSANLVRKRNLPKGPNAHCSQCGRQLTYPRICSACWKEVSVAKLRFIMAIRAVAFDFGHTLIDEQRDGTISLESRPIHLMPGVFEILPRIPIPLAVWANTRTATGADLRRFLDRAGIGQFFAWVITSVDAGFRKPAPEFFDFALSKCGLSRDEVVFVGNQLNTDIAGGQEFGIRTVWLCGSAYHSRDETLSPQVVRPTHTIHTLRQLPSLLQRIRDVK